MKYFIHTENKKTSYKREEIETMAKQLLDVKLKIDLKKFYQDLETESAKYVYHCDKVILAKVHEQFDSKGGIP